MSWRASKTRLADDVADGVDMRDVGPHPPVDGNKAAFGNSDTRVLGTDLLAVRAAADESHLEFVMSGTSHWIVEKTLEDEKIHPRIALKLPNFLGMAAIVASTDVIATVPQRLAATLAKTSNIRMFTPPISIPEFAVTQHWHVRFHKDPRNKWLRETFASLFLEESRKQQILNCNDATLPRPTRAPRQPVG